MRQISIASVIWACLNLMIFSQVRGEFCCNNNWTRINFITSDSLDIVKPLYWSHYPGMGGGHYKLKNDSLYIDYNHRSNTYYRVITNDSISSDSVELIFKADVPTRMIYLTQQDTLPPTYIHSILKIKKRDDSLRIESFFSGLVIPSMVLHQKKILGLEIHLDETLFIRKKTDRFKLAILNESEILLNNQALKKCNCHKKATPIY